jgi:hypothetical protein
MNAPVTDLPVRAQAAPLPPADPVPVTLAWPPSRASAETFAADAAFLRSRR